MAHAAFAYLSLDVYYIKTTYYSDGDLSAAGKVQEHVVRIHDQFSELQSFDVDTIATSGMPSEILCDNEQPLVIDGQLRQSW